MIKVKKYQDRDKDIWNQLISKADNRHFMFQRDYMDYHHDRFVDFSYLVFSDNHLIAVFPGCKQDRLWNSHGGLTFGGLIISSKNNRIGLICEIYDAFFDQLQKDGFHEAFIKPLPSIYHVFSCEGELYALGKEKIIEQLTEVTTTVDLRSRASVSNLRKRQQKKANNYGLSVHRDDDYEPFWRILSARLESKYETEPVHTLTEIIKISAKFPNNISLYKVLDKDKTCLGGCVIFINDTVWHAQYISSTDKGMKLGALDLLFMSLIENAQNAEAHYFDFGISTENNGLFLNRTLAQFKEGFGGRSVIHRKIKVKV